MPRLVKFGLVAAPAPAAFALGFILSRYLIDRDLREAEAALMTSRANYETARAEQVAQLTTYYGRVQNLIDRLEAGRSKPNVVEH